MTRPMPSFTYAKTYVLREGSKMPFEARYLGQGKDEDKSPTFRFVGLLNGRETNHVFSVQVQCFVNGLWHVLDEETLVQAGASALLDDLRKPSLPLQGENPLGESWSRRKARLVLAAVSDWLHTRNL